MPDATARTEPREASIEAVVIRADGTREELGRVAYWNRNPLRRWWGVAQIRRRERQRMRRS